jgi:hypothetical protein
MEDAKSSLGSMELLTGVKLDSGEVVKHVVFRELAGVEEDVLASGTMPVSQKITTILANCTVELGPIKDQVEIRKLIEKVVIADRWNYLIALRCLSLGSNYTQSSKCPECDHEDKIMVDLRELGKDEHGNSTIKSPDATQLFHEFSLPNGKSIRWKIADGNTELKIEKMAREDNKATIGLYARCTEVDSKPASLADIKSLSMKERTAFRKEIEEKEGDFDDNFEATCPNCGATYKGKVRLEPQSFFFP